MRRLGQQTWFCIAAAFLAMTLSVVWSQDVEVAAEDLPSESRTDRGSVIRRRQDLDPAVTEIQKGPVQRSQASRPAAILPKILENGSNPLPETALPKGDQSAPVASSPDTGLDIERAGYREEGNHGKKQAVWFRGMIEPVP